MPRINRDLCEITRTVIAEAQEQITAQLINPLYAELPGISFQEFASDFFKKMEKLARFASDLSHTPDKTDLPTHLVPLFKALFLQARLAKARELDDQRSKTTNPEVISALEQKLQVYDGIIRKKWFQAADPEFPPALSDVLNLERIETLETELVLPDRQYDEKFHILQAPALFLPDLHYYRVKCGTRGLSVAIAFLDIDKFKEFNSDVGHTHVDRHVLPPFMRSLEAHIYGHGYAYRFGGEEYVLLMPNSEMSWATQFIERFQTHIDSLPFYGTNKKITVSVGLCVADRDCHLTDGELLQKAERAMNFAKEQGRNCIASYADKLFDERELRVLAPR